MKDKNKDINYYDVFIAMTAYSKKAAEQLQEMLGNYTNVAAKAEEIHKTEHEADELLHDMMYKLNRAFITPIDREDIMMLSDKIDSITDSIKDTANLFDVFMIEQLRPEVGAMSALVVRSCETLYQAVVEFKSFKSSKSMKDHIIEVNRLEEEGDRLLRRITKELYARETSPVEIMKWKEIYDTLELVLNLCEDVADLLENVAVKNG